MIRNALLFCLCPLALTPAHAEVENDIKLGIEAVTGIRTGYIHRGYDLADASLEFQLQAEFALSNRILAQLRTLASGGKRRRLFRQLGLSGIGSPSRRATLVWRITYLS